MTAAPLNACTIDVEDYFQVSNFERVVDRKDWDAFEPRVGASTRRILELLARGGVRGTFFVLGWVAERNRDLVREIDSAGHEIASHGYHHQLVYDLSLEEFRADIKRSKDLLEAEVGKPVTAYRAPSFSITQKSLAALEILAEEGFRYDSSIFPIHHDRYGIPDAPLEPFSIQTKSGTIIEFPPSVYTLGSLRLPVGGGGYFRLYPYAVTRHCARMINDAGRPVNLYLHPWEFDPGQPRIGGISRLARFRHYVNLKTTEPKFSRLLGSARFGRFCDALDESQARGIRSMSVNGSSLVELPPATSESPYAAASGANSLVGSN